MGVSLRYAAKNQLANQVDAVRDTALVVLMPLPIKSVSGSPIRVGNHLVVIMDAANVQHVMAEISVPVMLPASLLDSKPVLMDAVP